MGFLGSLIKKNECDLTVLLPILLFVILSMRVIYFNSAPDSVLISAIPDDAFYYIQMAIHRVAIGSWSFDGLNISTGFHLLYGYLLFIIYKLLGHVEWRWLSIGIDGIATIFISLSAYFVARTVKKIANESAVYLALAPFFTLISIIQSTSMMESWMVILIASLTVYFIISDCNKRLIFLLFIGVLGSLARTDYAILPIGLMIGIILTRNRDAKLLLRSFLVAVGSVIGLLIVIWHSYTVSGHYFQSSAMIKYHWSLLAGHPIKPVLSMVTQIVFPFDISSLRKIDLFKGGYHGYHIAFILSAVMLLIAAFYITKIQKNKANYEVRNSFLVGSVVVLIGYILLYRLDSQSIQPWYSANLIVPSGILMALVGYAVFKRILLIVGFVSFSFFLLRGLSGLFDGVWMHQSDMMNAGYYLKNSKISSPVGAWNAGIISYFSGKTVINLDGLANDNAAAYILSNNLLSYIRKSNINYIMDYSGMIYDKNYRVRGGYENDGLDGCIVPTHFFTKNNKSWCGTYLVLYKIDQACLIK